MVSNKIKLITFTGSTGAGKTTIAGELMRRYTECKWLGGYTTRQLRPTDLPGEYYSISKEEFLHLVNEDRFVEWVQVHGNDYYGTLKESVDSIIHGSNSVFFKTIDPIGLLKLITYAPTVVRSFYVLAPSEDILQKRLRDRGETEETIARRLIDCKRWDVDARASSIPYIFIRNERTVGEIVDHVLEYLTDVFPRSAA